MAKDLRVACGITAGRGVVILSFWTGCAVLGLFGTVVAEIGAMHLACDLVAIPSSLRFIEYFP